MSLVFIPDRSDSAIVIVSSTCNKFIVNVMDGVNDQVLGVIRVLVFQNPVITQKELTSCCLEAAFKVFLFVVLLIANLSKHDWQSVYAMAFVLIDSFYAAQCCVSYNSGLRTLVLSDTSLSKLHKLDIGGTFSLALS